MSQQAVDFWQKIAYNDSKNSTIEGGNWLCLLSKTL